MKLTKSPIIILLVLLGLSACNANKKNAEPIDFVTVGEDGKFHIGDSVYNFVGTNFWYGAILASQGRGGDRERLARELDLMQENGVTNLRILVGGDGPEGRYAHIMPVLQPEPGVYNDTILDGLDYLMAELEKRNMHAVLYLNNSWEWSGGYSAYLEWATGETAKIPAIDGYEPYCDYVAKFVLNDSAKNMAANHVKYIVGRTNRYTGKPYSESPAIMSWQIANEPRPFAKDSLTIAKFYEWLVETAALIHSIDKNHLVSTGSEGSIGCGGDFELWKKIHNSPEIDYATIHIWPLNWGWVTAETITDSLQTAINYSTEYAKEHAHGINKPIVIEEFGYPRDGKEFAIGTSTQARDKYYSAILNMVKNIDGIEGSNFWPWGGYAIPQHENWEPWDQYTGDPAQEPQGLYSVFASDTTTLSIVKESSKRLTSHK